MVGGDQELLDLLTQDQVDAVIMNNEKATKAVALRSDVRELHDLTPEFNRLGMRNWFVGDSNFFEKHPELLEPVVSAYKEAVKEIIDDPAGMTKLIAPLLEIDAAQIEKEFRTLPPVVEVYGYDELAKILYENGDLEKPAKLFNQLPNYESIPKK
jgi:ABC-type nitrate/sulfonate/bicarbonate transport system substrate-binding protein